MFEYERIEKVQIERDVLDANERQAVDDRVEIGEVAVAPETNHVGLKERVGEIGDDQRLNERVGEHERTQALRERACG